MRRKLGGDGAALRFGDQPAGFGLLVITGIPVVDQLAVLVGDGEAMARANGAVESAEVEEVEMGIQSGIVAEDAGDQVDAEQAAAVDLLGSGIVFGELQLDALQLGERLEQLLLDGKFAVGAGVVVEPRSTESEFQILHDLEHGAEFLLVGGFGAGQGVDSVVHGKDLLQKIVQRAGIWD